MEYYFSITPIEILKCEKASAMMFNFTLSLKACKIYYIILQKDRLIVKKTSGKKNFWIQLGFVSTFFSGLWKLLNQIDCGPLYD